MNLYELTRKLVARGCPDIPSDNGFVGPVLQYHEPTKGWEISDCDACFYGPELARYHDAALVRVPESYARAVWTMHALEWFRALDTTKVLFDGSERMVRHALKLMAEHSRGEGAYIPDTLEAIEAATRHLEAK